MRVIDEVDIRQSPGRFERLKRNHSEVEINTGGSNTLEFFKFKHFNQVY